MTTAVLWDRLPAELRQCNQWVIAGPDKTPLAIGQQGLYGASSTEPQQWHDFNTAAYRAYAENLGIGFCLHSTDPYTCIDLDVVDAETQAAKGLPIDEKQHTTRAQFDKYWAIIQYFDSYTERSRSGKGFHIWVRGKVGKGARRFNMEVYSQARYIICTGNVVLDRAIGERQAQVQQFADSLRGVDSDNEVELLEVAPLEDDHTIFKRAMAADNGDKFTELAMGRWQQYGFPSQSEADLALMSMFTFYSKSNEQCRRMFRLTALGQREKANKNNTYLDYTLRTIRTRQKREEVHDVNADSLVTNYVAELNAKHAAQRAEPVPLHVQGVADDPVTQPPTATAVAVAAPVTAAQALAGEEGLPWPPGLTGALAIAIYQSAPRPVKEVAIVAALGLLAGIVGKAYHIPQSGLNLYIILIARSAIGKEAMHSGISALLRAASNRCPAIMQFVDFSDFASGPALVKTCAMNASFCNVAGEWGRKLKKLAKDDGRDAAIAGLRTAMTNLYQKSGPQSMVGGITYSNRDSNIASVSGVSFSMIGETTPSTFYESLTESMMADGFLSRFNIVEYLGERPPLNEHPVLEPNKALGDALGEIAQVVNGQLGRGNSQQVGRTDISAGMMGAFDKECDAQINSTTDEMHRQMWNRASLKVMRIAAILAVADNHILPNIEPHHVEWALLLVRKDIEIMSRKIESGDVGVDDFSRERKVVTIIKDYLLNGASDGYKVPAAMQKMGIVPRKLLQIRTSRLAAFTSHQRGATAALDETIRSMMANGYLKESKADKMSEAYNFYGVCYLVLPLPDYDAERKIKK